MNLAINKIRKIHDTLLRPVQILCNGRQVPSPLHSLLPLPSWQSNKLSRSAWPTHVLSAKNSNISDNSVADLSYRERLQVAVQNSLHVSLLKVSKYTQIHANAYNGADTFHDTRENCNLQSHKSFPYEFTLFFEYKILLNFVPSRNYSFFTKKFAEFDNDIKKI